MGIAKPARRGPVRIVSNAVTLERFHSLRPVARGETVIATTLGLERKWRVVLVVGLDALLERQVELTAEERQAREARQLRRITHRSSFEVAPVSACRVFA